jgi:hypothetical protein
LTGEYVQVVSYVLAANLMKVVHELLLLKRNSLVDVHALSFLLSSSFWDLKMRNFAMAVLRLLAVLYSSGFRCPLIMADTRVFLPAQS